jgi:hypothetical protein
MIPELLVNHFNPKISSSDMLTDFDSNLLLIYETAIKCKGVQRLMELLLLEETQIKSKRMLSMKCQLPTATSP